MPASQAIRIVTICWQRGAGWCPGTIAAVAKIFVRVTTRWLRIPKKRRRKIYGVKFVAGGTESWEMNGNHRKFFRTREAAVRSLHPRQRLLLDARSDVVIQEFLLDQTHWLADAAEVPRDDESAKTS